VSIKIEKDNSISISGFDKGIGGSILSDFSDMLGVNNDIPGVLSVGYKFTKLTETIAPRNFVIASAGNDYFTLNPADTTLHRKAVKLTTTGTLPTGLNTTDIFYLWDINSDGEDFRFCENLADVGSSYINLTNTGTGTHSFTVLQPEIVKGYTLDSYLNLYLLDSQQRVWFSQSSSNYQTYYLLDGNTSSGSGNGILFYAGFILVWGNSKMDALAEINDVGTSLLWSNDFVSGSILSGATYPAKGACPFYSQYDNAIYFGNGNVTGAKGIYRVALLEENVGKTFSPTDTSTFTFVPDAVEIPYASGQGYVQSINESGENIILGTGSNTIYYWDRKSILPISVVNMPENNTSSIIVKGGKVFAFNGYNGKFYQISMTDYGEVLEIPEHLFSLNYIKDSALQGDRINIEYTDARLYLDEILFAVEVNGKAYVMSYNIKTKSLTKKNISSYGETLTDSSTVGCINQIITLSQTQSSKNNVLISTSKRASSAFTYALESWQSGTSNYHKVYDNDEAYVSTGLISLGEDYNKKTLRELQLSFTRALTTGQSIKVYYRLDDNSAWTELKTIDYTTYGAIKDIKIPAPITDIKDLQIKIVINGYNSTSATGTSPRLKLVRLIP
jgi:hypothetical protein